MLQIRLSKTSASDGSAGVKQSPVETVTIACPDHLILADLPVAKGIGTPSTASLVRNVGRRFRRQLGERVHFCVRCDFPIAIYGRLSPCDHAFCLDCARSDSLCYLCDERIQKIQTVKVMEGILICAAPHCLKSFFKKVEFESHIHENHANLVRSNADKEDGNESEAQSVRQPAASDSTARGTTVPKEVDYANYFCTYSFLYHQKETLSDRVRMYAYFNAVFENKHHCKDRVVLDVGAESGILAIWSAQAGAKKVHAVEATKMSEPARALVKENNLENVVEVIEASMEDVTLPEKVDVIISEWMGYYLLRESMFDSVICDCDRWLKPTGVMYLSHARRWMAPIKTGIVEQKLEDYQSAMGDWHNFVDETKAFYGVDMSTLAKSFAEEQRKYYLQTSLWSKLHPHQVMLVLLHLHVEWLRDNYMLVHRGTHVTMVELFTLHQL